MTDKSMTAPKTNALSRVLETRAIYGTWALMKADLEYATTELDALLAEHAALREADRWIPVSERLPDTSDAVLVVWHTRYCAVARWYDGEWWTDGGILNGLTSHWRPLPAPPANETPNDAR